MLRTRGTDTDGRPAAIPGQHPAGPTAASPDRLVTEFTFALPRGYVDGSGTVHRSGVMRLATARDELIPLRDDRVRETPPTSPSSCSPGSLPGWAASTTFTPASWRTCSPPTWPSCKTSIGGSMPRATPAPRSPARPAVTSSPSTCPAAAWGNSHVRGRPPAGGGRVPRLPPALAVGHPARPGTRRPRDVHRPRRPDRLPSPLRKVTLVPGWRRNKGRCACC